MAVYFLAMSGSDRVTPFKCLKLFFNFFAQNSQGGTYLINNNINWLIFASEEQTIA
ncbi:hypothetical protein [Okeania sp. SIO2B3]|uniref:hypothetical protein n=1 Tax=Okeania sp. SIO2B3 TaxID=2607784 RepID=UPI0013BFEA93|nr:hypothetical protein [Okeania sp. SIO2B3]NET43931.1 hypothetical protein [Okeania sp. SIO2B3]